MKKHSCPNCHNQSIGIWQKLFIYSDPAFNACNAELMTLYKWHILSLIPIFAYFCLIIFFVVPIQLSMLLSISAVIVSFAITNYAAPIQIKNVNKTAKAV